MENILNSIINSTVQITRNANIPSSDSGYLPNRYFSQNINSNPGLDWLTITFYTGMILIAMFLISSGLKKKQSKLN